MHGRIRVLAGDRYVDSQSIISEAPKMETARRSLHDLAKENNIEEMVKILNSHERLNAKDKHKR